MSIPRLARGAFVLGILSGASAGAQTLSINDVTVTEGNSGTVNATFTISLSAPSGVTVTVGCLTSGCSRRLRRYPLDEHHAEMSQ